MDKIDFYYDSIVRGERIHAIKWIPDGKPKAIVQIVHGMTEYVGRYEELATYLCERGYLVAGNDHLGHGGSIGDNPPGYFCKNDPAGKLVEDVETLRRMLCAECADTPVIMLGHSMGSLITRNYITVYGDKLAGAIISGTLLMPMGMMHLMGALVKILTAIKGEKAESNTLDSIAFGAFNKRIKNPRTKSDWLTKDESIIDSYRDDPWCTFTFTNNGFGALQQLGVRLHDKKRLASIPKNLPMLFVYGEEDPCGDYGVGAHKACESYVNLGLKVKEIAYPGDRHEILNETDRDKVMADIYEWIEDTIA